MTLFKIACAYLFISLTFFSNAFSLVTFPKETLKFLTTNELENIKKIQKDSSVRSSYNLDQDFSKLAELSAHIFNLKKAGISIYNIMLEKKNNFQSLELNEIKLLRSHLLRRYQTRKKLEFYVERYYPYLLLNDVDEETLITGVLMMLTATFNILDDYQEVIKIVELKDKLNHNNDSLHLLINEKLDSIWDELIQYEQKDLIFKKIHAARFFTKNQKEITSSYSEHSAIKFLSKVITSSPTYKTYLKETKSSTFSKILRFFNIEYLFKTNIFEYFNRENIDKITFLFSKLFSDITGDIQWRKGKLYNNIIVKKELENILKPMDIIMDKTPFKLSDTFIPGHWGHDAIWIGNKQQLKRLGIWQHPIVKKYHSKILEGKSILEALRSSVTLNNMSKFMNLDDIAVVRKANLSKKEKAQKIIKLLELIGIEYDFNFDLKTKSKLFCSEVIFNSFDKTPWQTQYIFGRNTISPDHVANILFDTKEYFIKLFYTDGKKVPKDHYLSTMKKLVLGEGSLN